MGGVPRQSGFSLVAALFLLVILAALGAFAVVISSVQQTTAALAAEQAKAFYAARAGKEWAVYRVLSDGDCSNVGGSFVIDDGSGTLDEFTVEVLRCQRSQHRVRGELVSQFDISVRARRGTYGTPDFVSRTVRVEISS